MKYSRRGEISYQTSKIGKLIDDGNYNLAWKTINDLLPKYMEDERLKFQMVCLNLIEKNYDEALILIEELNEKRNFITKTELYVLLGNEDKEFEMYKKYFKVFNFDNPFYIQDNRYRLLYIYLNKKFNLGFELPKFLGTNYLEQQIYSYSRERALENIRLNHFEASNMDKGIFDSSVNIEEIYDYVDNVIKNTDVIGKIKFGKQVYRFLYPNCGLVRSGEVANGFSVVVSLGTRDIIAIYPSRMRCIDDAMEYEPLKKETKKVKIRNGLERFNDRYNK